MEDKQGGRARGRARGRSTRPPQQQQQGGAPRPQQPGGQPATAKPPPGFEARGAPPGFQQPRGPPAQGGPPSTGRASVRTGGRPEQPGDAGLSRQMHQMAIGGNGNGNGNGNGAVGRGSVRGRRQLPGEIPRTRPVELTSKKGGSGHAVKLIANYFKILHHTDWCLYQYRVDFAPEEDRTGVKKGLLKPHKATIGGYIFDGTVMYTSNRLPRDEMEFASIRQSDEARIVITVRLVGNLAPGDYHYLQFFNIIMRKSLGHLDLQLVGRNFFDPQARVIIREHKLELWPGYITSIRQHENEILMCGEITHKVMRTDSVLSQLVECTQDQRNRDFRGAFSKLILGAIVLTTYNNKTYRVDDVDWSLNPKSRFAQRDGTEITYMDYYKQRYNLNINDKEQPLLVSMPKDRDRRGGITTHILLIPELCRMTGLNDDMRQNFQLMRAMADHTRVGPEGRVAKLKDFCDRLLRQPQVAEDLKEWQLSLDRELVSVNARVVMPEKIVLGNQRSVPVGKDVDWTRDLRSNAMLVCAVLRDWVVMTPGRNKRDASAFVALLQKAGGGMRFAFPNPEYYEMPDDRVNSYVQGCDDVFSSNPQLIMCVLSNNRLDRYAAIKKKCCVDRGIPTQMIVARNLGSKGAMSIATKVAIQINCKLGGAPWTVEIPMKGLMVAGFDVYHDSAQRGKSVGALVASMNDKQSTWFSAVAHHSSGEELSNELSVNMVSALRRYKEKNGFLPNRIVMYRDGVGEGQVPFVFEHEVRQLKSQLVKVYGEQPLRFGFIVVTKRINTRLFTMPVGNPEPGTVVDDVITLPERYDFYLVSQSVRQGTVSPTSYNVLEDTLGLDPDKIQRLTYKMTHLYYNWSGTVRVPAPCQYAHKLAYLVGQALHRKPSEKLADTLYFL